jgi:hypothetical protein
MPAGLRMRRITAALITIAMALLTTAGAAAVVRAARSARTLSVRDEGYLRFKQSSGSQIIDEGNVSGTIRGRARVRFTYTGSPTVTSQFTLYGGGGSLSGYASGRLDNPTSTSPSFRGRMILTSGRGRFAHAHGHGELFGVFYRRSYGLSVQAIGHLSY